jgi:hypothetical protein
VPGLQSSTSKSSGFMKAFRDTSFVLNSFSNGTIPLGMNFVFSYMTLFPLIILGMK